jgi:hypothetical protein
MEFDPHTCKCHGPWHLNQFNTSGVSWTKHPLQSPPFVQKSTSIHPASFPRIQDPERERQEPTHIWSPAHHPNWWLLLNIITNLGIIPNSEHSNAVHDTMLLHREIYRCETNSFQVWPTGVEYFEVKLGEMAADWASGFKFSRQERWSRLTMAGSHSAGPPRSKLHRRQQTARPSSQHSTTGPAFSELMVAASHNVPTTERDRPWNDDVSW